MPIPDRMFQVATLNATPVGERWLGALGEPAQAIKPNPMIEMRMSLERGFTLGL
jgi:hypothetical protein